MRVTMPQALALVRAILCLACGAASGQGGITKPYIDARHLTAIPFGGHSHWAQPWRAYMETVPATSVSHALDMRLSLIMDIKVQGTMP